LTISRSRNGSLTSFVKLLGASLPRSYSAIFFSSRAYLGFIVLGATLLYPHMGILGVLGTLFAGTWAFILGTDRQSIRTGAYGFNGALVGLAVGSWYALNPHSILFLLLATLFLTLVTIFLNHVYYHYLGLPALSMPFNVTASLVLLAGYSLSSLVPTQSSSLLDIRLPFAPSINAFLSSFSAILFQPDPLSGLVIAIGILLYSRIAFTLMAVGFIVAWQIHTGFGLDVGIINEQFLGFNAMFVALALGGVFIVPSAGSLFLAMAASAVTVLLTAACIQFLPAPLMPLAFPLNSAISLFLYALHRRAYPSLNITLAANSSLSPEENLRKHHEALKQWKKPATTIALPFHGRWKVTQGIDGKITHKEDWRFAYDFQAVDFSGKTYRSDGTALEDYYSFGLPIIAPANGKVHSLRDDIADNVIGRVNTADNWGNYLILEHAPGWYSCLAHLKQGSLKVTEGQEVKKGEILASCGNSGRSPYPHIHLQFQMLPKIGSPSISFDFSNILSAGGPLLFIPQGIVAENAVVQNMTPSNNYEEFFPYTLNQVWTYKTTFKKKERNEFWHTDLDFYGNAFLTSSPNSTKLYYQLAEGVLSMKAIEGPGNNGLTLMNSLIAEVPFSSGSEPVAWTSFEPMDYGIPPLVRSLVDVLSLLGFNLMVNREYLETSAQDEVTLRIRSTLFLKIPFSTISLRKLSDAEMTFKRKVGLQALTSGEREVRHYLV